MSEMISPPPGVVGEPIQKDQVRRWDNVDIQMEHDGKSYDCRLYFFLKTLGIDGVYWDFPTMHDRRLHIKKLNEVFGIPERDNQLPPAR